MNRLPKATKPRLERCENMSLIQQRQISKSMAMKVSAPSIFYFKVHALPTTYSLWSLLTIRPNGDGDVPRRHHLAHLNAPTRPDKG